MSESSTSVRAHLASAKRVVVKVGSNALLSEPDCVSWLAGEVATLRESGRDVVIVSSGAIACGVSRLGLAERPKTLAGLQAAAAVGQGRLMQRYDSAFGEHGLPIAQILLTHASFADRERYLHASRALDAVMTMGAVPVVNENDTVATDEIRFGDNDQLAAMVGTLVSADLLILVTDVPGVLDAHGAVISLVTDATEVTPYLKDPASDVGTGGMVSKVEAARKATLRGCPVVIFGARETGALSRILEGEEMGTLFLPKGARLPSRKHWIAYTLKAKGALVVDAGAVTALREGTKSLLPAGVVGARGDFAAGDAVRVVSPEGQEFARGLVRYATGDVAKLAGARTEEIADRLGRSGSKAIIHKDDLVITQA
jgi:glutamate 5-kinase